MAVSIILCAIDAAEKGVIPVWVCVTPSPFGCRSRSTASSLCARREAPTLTSSMSIAAGNPQAVRVYFSRGMRDVSTAGGAESLATSEPASTSSNHMDSPQRRPLHLLVMLALAASAAGLAARPLAAQTDYYTTDRGRPLQIEDAYATERHAFEL